MKTRKLNGKSNEGSRVQKKVWWKLKSPNESLMKAQQVKGKPKENSKVQIEV